MTTSTLNLTQDWEKTTSCPHCGKTLPMQIVSTSFGVFERDFELCDCPQAIADQEVAQARADEQLRREQAEQNAITIAKAGIPKRYLNARHANTQMVVDLVREGKGAYIFGGNGTGKSTLAYAAALTLIEQGINVFCVSTYDLMDAMRSRKDEDRIMFEKARTCSVLVLDDLGKEASNTEYACEKLFAIVDSRDKAMKPTIVTSNFKLSEIARNITEGAVGTAIASRLCATCKQIPMTGKDWRLPNG